MRLGMKNSSYDGYHYSAESTNKTSALGLISLIRLAC